MPSNVNETVKKIIKKEDRSVSKVAIRMGVSPQSLGSMLRKDYNMSVKYLLRILKALGHYQLLITTDLKAEKLKSEDRNGTVYILSLNDEEEDQ